jgi:hypothetical protein
MKLPNFEKIGLGIIPFFWYSFNSTILFTFNVQISLSEWLLLSNAQLSLFHEHLILTQYCRQIATN